MANLSGWEVRTSGRGKEGEEDDHVAGDPEAGDDRDEAGVEDQPIVERHFSGKPILPKLIFLFRIFCRLI